MKIAAAAYPVQALPDRDALAAKLARWIADAGDADLLVFPEYAGLEAGLVGVQAPLSEAEECARCTQAAPGYWRLLAALARQSGKTILAGSLPVQTPQGWRNRAAWICPDGTAAFLDKVQLTPWERRATPLEAGAGTGPLQMPDGTRVGVLICYDGEFPLQARTLREAGADLLLMPSATEAMSGHTRVRLAARTRALEGAQQVVLSQLVGTCPVSAFADVSTGRAGHYGPPDAGWSDSGILTETALDTQGWSTHILHQPTTPPEVSIATHWTERDFRAEPPQFRPISQNNP